MIERKYIIAVIVGFIVICILYFLLVLYPRIGKLPVEVLVNPSDATVYLNDARISPGTHYLHAGTFTFKAEREGWSPDEVNLTISDELSSVALVLTPITAEAIEQAERETQTREGLSSIAANARGLDIRSAHPILNELPYSDTAGPFKIDYGFNQDDSKTPYLIISFSSPNGRVKALDWLKDNGLDITTTEVIFEDYRSPIFKEEDSHEHE